MHKVLSVKIFPVHITQRVRPCYSHCSILCPHSEKKKNQIYIFWNKSVCFCSAKLFLSELSSVPDRSPPLWKWWLALGAQVQELDRKRLPISLLYFCWCSRTSKSELGGHIALAELLPCFFYNSLLVVAQFASIPEWWCAPKLGKSEILVSLENFYSTPLLYC